MEYPTFPSTGELIPDFSHQQYQAPSHRWWHVFHPLESVGFTWVQSLFVMSLRGYVLDMIHRIYPKFPDLEILWIFVLVSTTYSYSYRFPKRQPLLDVKFRVLSPFGFTLRIMGSQVPGGLDIPEPCEKQSQTPLFCRVQWFLGR